MPALPSVAAAMRLTNAQAKSEQLVTRLTNFVFICIISFFLFWPSVTSRYCRLRQGSGAPRSCHFWPFSDVQNGNQREVTGKLASRSFSP
jgi:hypothetical protein